MRLRAVVSLVAVSLSAIAVGCGSSSSSATSGPLTTELSYFPAGSPLVVAIATDPQGAAVQNAMGLLGAFPLASLGITALESKLQSIGVSFQSGIKPLFGNPIALGVLEVPTSSRLTRSSFLAVWMTKSAAKLDALVKGLPGFAPTGSVAGATLYGSGGVTVAVDGATAVLGSPRAALTAALNRHAHGGGLSSADFSRAMGSLPRDALVRAFGSMTTVLGPVRKIPWVGAIRGYAATLSATSAGISARFRLDTSGGPLTSSQLPIASGTRAPELAGTLPIVVGIHDPAHTLTFVEAAAQAVDPAGYAQFQRREKKTGADLNAFAALLTGNLMIESDTRTTMGRAQVSDPAGAARQLAKLPPLLRAIFPTATGITRLPGGFYAVKGGRGQSVDLGLAGNELVAGVATPAQLRAFATAPAAPAPNAQGPVAFRASLLDLLRLATEHTPTTLLSSILSILGTVTGSASATPGALTGRLSLPIR